MSQYLNIFTSDQIEYLSKLPAVLAARYEIDQKAAGSVQFTSQISNDIKTTLHNSIGLDLTNISDVPMRWIKGDLAPHKDTGSEEFNNTYLVYLTDSPGEFIIGDARYPISTGAAYVFNEGLLHETINTGSEPRLLLGPMSEHGLPVGAGPFTIEGDGGTTIYIKQNGLIVEYSTDNSTWNLISWPCGIRNTNTSLGFLTVEFTTDITLDTNDQRYFICSPYTLTGYIQFGSNSLKTDGTRPIITVNDIPDYPGLISNGDSSASNSCNNIRICNLEVHATGTTTLAGNAGWIGQYFFGISVTDNYIINCRTVGNILSYSGGIVGGSSGGGSGAQLTIIGCSSSGNIGNYCGGIIGQNSGFSNGSLSCSMCWSEGNITGDSAGGIAGQSCGSSGGSLTITNCYSLGDVSGTSAGGIIGASAGATGGTVTITNAYSTGTINGVQSGGIVGANSTSTTVNNCYSIGIVDGSVDAGGIFGLGYSGYTITHCYTIAGPNVNGFILAGVDTEPANCYSEGKHGSSSWDNANAENTLDGVPSPVVGTVWIFKGNALPYELRNMGYTPYTIQNINTSGTPGLKQSYTATIVAGNGTSAAIISGAAYSKLQITGGTSGSYSAITIDATTGVISTTTAVTAGVYTIYIRNTGSYNISSVVLTVTSPDPVPCLTEETMVLTPSGYINVTELNIGDFVLTSDGRKSQITALYQTIVMGSPKTFPCIVPKNSIAENYPVEDFRISQHHLIKHGDEWILPKYRFSIDDTYPTIKYFHIQLENYKKDHLVINNGVIVESYAKNSSEYKRRVKAALQLLNNKVE